MKTEKICPLFDKTHLSLFLTILISMSFCPAGDLAPQTRSRKLLERPREDSMHIWLGFKNREEMEKAMREKKKAQQHQQQRNSRRGSVVVMNEITENYGTVLRVCLDNS